MAEPGPGHCSPFWPWRGLMYIHGHKGWQESTCSYALEGLRTFCVAPGWGEPGEQWRSSRC